MRRVAIKITDDANKINSILLQKYVDDFVFLMENEGLDVEVSCNYSSSNKSDYDNAVTKSEHPFPKELSKFDKFKKRYLRPYRHNVSNAEASFRRLYNYDVD